MSTSPDWNTPRASMTRELSSSNRRRFFIRLTSVLALALLAFVSGVLSSAQEPDSLPVRVVVAVTSFF